MAGGKTGRAAADRAALSCADSCATANGSDAGSVLSRRFSAGWLVAALMLFAGDSPADQSNQAADEQWRHQHHAEAGAGIGRLALPFPLMRAAGAIGTPGGTAADV